MRDCPLCASRAPRPFETIGGTGGEISFVICAKCGMVYQPEKVDSLDLEAFYRRGYRQSVQVVEEPIEKDIFTQQARARAQLGFIRSRLDRVRLHLDIGCSSGALLEAVSGHFGCRSVGVEPGEAYREYASRRGLTVVPTIEDLAPDLHGAVDLISISHVLEHVPEPVALLTDLRTRLLAPGGWVLIETPNLYEHPSLEPAHLTAFTGSTLRAVTERAGLRVLAVRAHGGFRSRTLALYLKLLAREDGLFASRLPRALPAGVRLARRLGSAKRRLLTRLLPARTWVAPETFLRQENGP